MAEIELLDTTDDVSASEHQVTKRGQSKWLALLPLLLVLGLLTLSRDRDGGDSALTAIPDSVAPELGSFEQEDLSSAEPEDADGGSGSFGNLRVTGNESERLGLIHGTHNYAKLIPEDGGGLGSPHVIAVRAGADLLVIDSENSHAHRIQLPPSSSAPEVGASSIALVLDKLIVADGSLLRSLSVQGGVDLILATGMAGYQVDGTRLVVAAETSDLRFDTQKVVDLRVQGVHADFFGVPERTRVPDGAKVVQIDGRIFVEFGGQTLVPFEEGLVPLHPGTVVAAGPNHGLIQDCSVLTREAESISCEALRVRLDGTEVVTFAAPVAFGVANYVLAPDGEQLFVVQDGSSTQRLLELVGETWEEIQSFEVAKIDAAAFSKDSLTLVTVSENAVSFWRDGTLVETWTLDEFPPITEVTVGR